MKNDTHNSQKGGEGVSFGVEEKQVAEELCSEAYLRRVTGEDDLGAVRNLVLTVDSNETQVTPLMVNSR